MKKYTHFLFPIFSLAAFVILILDSKTAIHGVTEGIELCLKTLAPALFPFLVISAICCSLMPFSQSRVLHTLFRPCRLPDGAEVIFLLGLLGGYPVGAKLISDAYCRRQLATEDAQRMLMFCNNAGPSFIFGIIGAMFSQPWVPWVIWGLHIMSAYVVGIITAKSNCSHIEPRNNKKTQITQIVSGSTRTIANICSWVILFKVLLVFMDKWFLYKLPVSLRVLISGLLELANGCTQLMQIDSENIRFLIVLLLLSFGGICITMQTASVIGELSVKHYLWGKCLQCATTILLSIPILMRNTGSFFPVLLVILIVLPIFIKHARIGVRKKVVAFHE